MISLHNADCIEFMKTLPDNSVDMCLTDPPYGTTACKWDSVIPFEQMWAELKRITKPSSNIVFSASQPFTSFLVASNPDWFSYGWVWEKEQGVNFLSANKMPLKVHEDILVFRKPDAWGVENLVELRGIFRAIKKRIGLSAKRVEEILGSGYDHSFRVDSNQFCIPSEEKYNMLLKHFNVVSEFPAYADIKSLYSAECYRVYIPQLEKGTPYTSGLGNSGEVTGSVKKTSTRNSGFRQPRSVIKFKRETGLHPTQKPVALLEYLIKTYTLENETVLDFTMGSGSTGVACVNLNRNFIGCELDKGYFDIAKNRIESGSK
jgi:site-specific DNA-methyltransferase (adenine-specific)